MRTFRKLILIAAATGLTSPAHAANEGAHGGDVFEIGGAKMVFDVIEHQYPFDPSDAKDPFGGDLAEPYAFIQAQLKIVAGKLPTTGAYLQSFLDNRAPLWWFVDAKLKPIEDQGPTPLILTYNDEQAAINHDGMVQISHPIWQALSKLPNGEDVKAKYYLITHELLWVATQAKVRQAGASIRTLTAILLHPALKRMSAENMASFLRKELTEDSPLENALRADLPGRPSGALNEELDARGVVDCVNYLQSQVFEARDYSYFSRDPADRVVVNYGPRQKAVILGHAKKLQNVNVNIDAFQYQFIYLVVDTRQNRCDFEATALKSFSGVALIRDHHWDPELADANLSEITFKYQVDSRTGGIEGRDSTTQIAPVSMSLSELTKLFQK